MSGDLVTHGLRKFVRLMLRRNGYVPEQLLSPLIVHTTDAHRELAALAPGVLTGHHAHHYRGFGVTQWRLFEKTGELKPLLYTFRVLLTGVHLMRSGPTSSGCTACWMKRRPRQRCPMPRASTTPSTTSS